MWFLPSNDTGGSFNKEKTDEGTCHAMIMLFNGIGRKNLEKWLVKALTVFNVQLYEFFAFWC